MAVLQFETPAGDPIAVYYNYAMHAVINGQLDKVSADFIGAASRYIEDSFDDKIVAVMVKDAVYGGVTDIGQLPGLLVERLKHYFLTYKQAPNATSASCELLRVYGRDEAHEVIRRSQQDYLDRFGAVLGPVLAQVER